MKHKNFLPLFLFVTAVVFSWSWLFGMWRFSWEPAFYLYAVLNFPFGFVYLLAEKYYWTHFSQSYFMNTEIVQGVFWLMSVLLQALFYAVIIRMMKRRKEKQRFMVTR